MPKALHIDSTARTVQEVTFETLADLHKLVGGYLEIAYGWPNGDTLFVDEDGMREPTSFFMFSRRPDQPLAGNGVVVGRELEGEQYPGGYTNADPVITREKLGSMVIFPNA